MKLAWLPGAVKDLAHIRQYHRRVASTDVANGQLKKISRAATLLVNQPYVGHVSPNHPGGDVLEWNIPNTSYTLPYMVNDKHIVIMRVFDQRQRRPASWG